MRGNDYIIEKNTEKILRNGTTRFLTPNLYRQLIKRLKKSEYKIFYPYEDAEKIVLYRDKVPEIVAYKICCKEELNHASILGSLFGLNIDTEMFGDIIFYEGDFYIYVLAEISTYIYHNLNMIGKKKVQLEEVSLSFLKTYHREFKTIELVVSSLRVDTILARLIGCNREKVQEKIKNKEILRNYEILNRASETLNQGDIFSARRHGKYLLSQIIGKTKKNHYIILLKKYM